MCLLLLIFENQNVKSQPTFAVMGAQAFAGGQQPPGGSAYAPRQDPLDSRASYSPHGGRTPGRGNFRTPFSSTSQPRSFQPQSQSAGVTLPLSESLLSSQVAMTAESSADATSTTQVMTNLEALSVTDSISTKRLSPIVTHTVLSPSNVILASIAGSNSPEGQNMPAVATAAQASPPMLPLQQEVQVSESASLPVSGPALTGFEMGNDAATDVEDTAAASSSSSLAAQPD